MECVCAESVAGGLGARPADAAEAAADRMGIGRSRVQDDDQFKVWWHLFGVDYYTEWLEKQGQ